MLLGPPDPDAAADERTRRWFTRRATGLLVGGNLSAARQRRRGRAATRRAVDPAALRGGQRDRATGWTGCSPSCSARAGSIRSPASSSGLHAGQSPTTAPRWIRGSPPGRSASRSSPRCAELGSATSGRNVASPARRRDVDALSEVVRDAVASLNLGCIVWLGRASASRGGHRCRVVAGETYGLGASIGRSASARVVRADVRAGGRIGRSAAALCGDARCGPRRLDGFGSVDRLQACASEHGLPRVEPRPAWGAQAARAAGRRRACTTTSEVTARVRQT